MADNKSPYDDFKTYLELVEASQQALQKGRNLQPEEALPLILTIIPDDEKEYIANAISADYEKGADISRTLRDSFKYLIEDSTKKAVELSKNDLEGIINDSPSDRLENLLNTILPEKTTMKEYEDTIKLHRKSNEIKHYLKGYQEAKNDSEKQSALNELKRKTIEILQEQYDDEEDEEIKEVLISIAANSEHYSLFKTSRYLSEIEEAYRKDIEGKEGEYISSLVSDERERFAYANFLIKGNEKND